MNVCKTVFVVGVSHQVLWLSQIAFDYVAIALIETFSSHF